LEPIELDGEDAGHGQVAHGFDLRFFTDDRPICQQFVHLSMPPPMLKHEVHVVCGVWCVVCGV